MIKIINHLSTDEIIGGLIIGEFIEPLLYKSATPSPNPDW